MRELKGLTVANDMTEKTLQRVQELEARGITPMLATVRVGANPGDIAYENGLLERAEKNGIDSEQIVLPENITQEDLLAEIDKLNQDPGVDGVLIFRPLPKQIDEEAIQISMNYGSSTSIPASDKAPVFEDIAFCDVTCAHAKRGIELTGLPESPLRNVHLTRCALRGDLPDKREYVESKEKEV